MPALYRHFFQAMWLSWTAYRWVSARNVKRTVRHESLPSRLSHVGPLAGDDELVTFLDGHRTAPI